MWKGKGKGGRTRNKARREVEDIHEVVPLYLLALSAQNANFGDLI